MTQMTMFTIDDNITLQGADDEDHDNQQHLQQHLKELDGFLSDDDLVSENNSMCSSVANDNDTPKNENNNCNYTASIIKDPSFYPGFPTTSTPFVKGLLYPDNENNDTVSSSFGNSSSKNKDNKYTSPNAVNYFYENGRLRSHEQLNILLNERDKLVLEQQDEIEKMNLESGQKFRFLTHELTLYRGEKESLEGRLKDLQSFFNDSEKKASALNSKLDRISEENTKLAAEKVLFETKLLTAMSTIDDLKKQLTSAITDEVTSKKHQNHEELVDHLKYDYDQRLYEVNTELDEKTVLLKENETKYQNLVDKMGREFENYNQEKQFLTCKIENLESALATTRQEFSKLNSTNHEKMMLSLQEELKMTKASKIAYMSENENLNEIIKDLRQQLRALELVDSISKSSPDPYSTRRSFSPCNDSSSPEAIVKSLKIELQRLLSSNNAKRQTIKNLQNQVDQLKNSQTKPGQVDQELELKANRELRKKQATIQELRAQNSIMETQLEDSQTENNQLQLELKKKLEKIANEVHFIMDFYQFTPKIEIDSSDELKKLEILIMGWKDNLNLDNDLKNTSDLKPKCRSVGITTKPLVRNVSLQCSLLNTELILKKFSAAFQVIKTDTMNHINESGERTQAIMFSELYLKKKIFLQQVASALENIFSSVTLPNDASRSLVNTIKVNISSFFSEEIRNLEQFNHVS